MEEKTSLNVAQAPIIKLSASSTKTFDSCPKKYYYTYIEKLPKKEWPHFLLGTFCHAVLEQFHKNWNKDKNLDLISLMGTSFAEQRTKFKILDDQLDEAKKLLQDYLFFVEKNGMPNTLSVEEPFELFIDKYVLRGFIDRLDVDKDGTFHIVDYKTTKSVSYLDDFQLLVYGLAIKKKYPDMQSFRGSYVLLRKGSKLVTNEYTLHDIEKCEKKLIEFGRRIEQEKKWEKRPSNLCKWCDFYEPCQLNNNNGNEIIDWIK